MAISIQIQSTGVADGIVLHKTAKRGIVIAQAVIIQAGVFVIPATGEHIGIANRAYGNLIAVAIIDRGSTKYVVRIAFHEIIVFVTECDYTVQTVDMVIIPGVRLTINIR